MALAVVEDEASNPVQISLFRPDAVVSQANLVTDAIEQPRGRCHERINAVDH